MILNWHAFEKIHILFQLFICEVILDLIGQEEVNGRNRTSRVRGGEMLDIPGDKGPRRSRSPVPAESDHSRHRSRSPSAFHHVPENVSRSLSPAR